MTSDCFTELASGMLDMALGMRNVRVGGVREADRWPDVGPRKTLAPFFRKTLPNNPQGFCGSCYCFMGLPVFDLQIRAASDEPTSSPDYLRGCKNRLTLGTQTFPRKYLE